MDIYFTVKQVSEKLNVKEGTIRNWISSRKIKSVKIFGATRISEEEIKNIIKEVR